MYNFNKKKMKKINFKSFLYIALAAGMAAGCADEPELPNYGTFVFQERFEQGTDNVIIGTEEEAPYTGWTNFAESGSAKWKIQKFNGNGYAEYSSFQTTGPISIGWLISPAIVLEEFNTNTLRFAVSQSFVSDEANKFEVFVSTDYDGTNVTAATWTEVDVNAPGPDADFFAFQDAGTIDLSPFSGNVHIAFKVTGTDTATDDQLDGSYQIDNFTILN